MKTDAFISNAIDQISIALFCVLLLQSYPAAGETFGERFQNLGIRIRPGADTIR